MRATKRMRTRVLDTEVIVRRTSRLSDWYSSTKPHDPRTGERHRPYAWAEPSCGDAGEDLVTFHWPGRGISWQDHGWYSTTDRCDAECRRYADHLFDNREVPCSR